MSPVKRNGRKRKDGYCSDPPSTRNDQLMLSFTVSLIFRDGRSADQSSQGRSALPTRFKFYETTAHDAGTRSLHGLHGRTSNLLEGE
jgi:hypothetical protein